MKPQLCQHPESDSASFSRWWGSPSLPKGHGQLCSLTQLTWPHGTAALQISCSSPTTSPKPTPRSGRAGGVRYGHPTLFSTETQWLLLGCEKEGEKCNKRQEYKDFQSKARLGRTYPFFSGLVCLSFSLFGLAYSCLRLPLLVA